MKQDLIPTSDVDKAILIGDEYVSQVRSAHLDTLQIVSAISWVYVEMRKQLLVSGLLCLVMSTTMLTTLDVPRVNTILMQSWQNALNLERLMLLLL